VLVKNIIGVCWGIFFVVWVVAALFTKRSIYHESGLDRLGYIILAVIGWYLLFGGNRLPHPFDFQLIPQATPSLSPLRAANGESVRDVL